MKKKNKILKPVRPLAGAEVSYYKQLRSYTSAFKKAVREEILPIVERYSSFTGDGIADDLNQAMQRVRDRFDSLGFASQIASRMISSVSSKNRERTLQAFKLSAGIDLTTLLQTEQLSTFTELQIAKNSELIKSVSGEAINDIQRIIFNSLAEGVRYEEIARQIAGNNKSSVFNKMGNRIKTIARTETAKINAQLSEKRYELAGVTKAIWDASADSRTRPCHQARDGKEFELAKGLYSSCDGKTIKPAEEINCRCVARPILEMV